MTNFISNKLLNKQLPRLCMNEGISLKDSSLWAQFYFQDIKILDEVKYNDFTISSLSIGGDSIIFEKVNSNFIKEKYPSNIWERQWCIIFCISSLQERQKG